MQLKFLSNEAKIKTNFQSKSKYPQNLALIKSKQRITNMKPLSYNKKLSSTLELAEKLANEALRSSEIKKRLKRMANVIPPIKAMKGYYKPIYKGPKRRKRKKYKCSFGLDCSYNSEHNMSKKPNTKIHQEETVDKKEIGKAGKAVRESFLEIVMKTTTKDPNKKNPGDPGMEYSEYYNDDDSDSNDFNDSPGEKVPTKDDNSKIRAEREIPDNEVSKKGDGLQKEKTNLIENENGFDSYESNFAVSDTDQKQNQVQLENPYFLLSPLKYETLNQTPVKDIVSNYKGSTNKINQALDSSKKPQKFNSGSETEFSNSTIFKSTNISSTKFYTSVTQNLFSSDNHSTNSNNITPTSLSDSKIIQNHKPLNSTVSFLNQGHVVQEGQLNSKLSKSDTQVIANEILSKIIDELEDLKTIQTKKFHKEGHPCRISGSWETSKAGVKLNMKVQNQTILITTEKLESSHNCEGLLNATWNLSGQSPFKHGGPFSINGINNKAKSLAVFIGSCRVCHGIDTIEGIWTITREPNGCRDFQIATGIYNDIFRRIKHHDNFNVTES